MSSLQTASQLATAKPSTPAEVKPFSEAAVANDPLAPLFFEELKAEGLREYRITALLEGGYFRDRSGASRFVLELVKQANGLPLAPEVQSWIDQHRADQLRRQELDVAAEAALARLNEHDRLAQSVERIETRLLHERGALVDLAATSSSAADGYLAWGGAHEPWRLDAFLLLEAKISAGKVALPRVIAHFERELEAAKAALDAFEKDPASSTATLPTS